MIRNDREVKYLAASFELSNKGIANVAAISQIIRLCDVPSMIMASPNLLHSFLSYPCISYGFQALHKLLEVPLNPFL